MARMLHCITLHLYCNVYIIWLCINKMVRGVLHSLWLCYKTYDHSHFNMVRRVLNWVLFWFFKRITTHTCHLSRPWLNKERLALFALGRGHMAPHAPNTSDLGALIPLTIRQIGTFCGMRMGAGFRHRKCSEAGFILPQVRNGEPVTGLEGEKWQKA